MVSHIRKRPKVQSYLNEIGRRRKFNPSTLPFHDVNNSYNYSNSKAVADLAEEIPVIQYSLKTQASMLSPDMSHMTPLESDLELEKRILEMRLKEYLTEKIAADVLEKKKKKEEEEEINDSNNIDRISVQNINDRHHCRHRHGGKHPNSEGRWVVVKSGHCIIDSLHPLTISLGEFRNEDRMKDIKGLLSKKEKMDNLSITLCLKGHKELRKEERMKKDHRRHKYRRRRRKHCTVDDERILDNLLDGMSNMMLDYSPGAESNRNQIPVRESNAAPHPPPHDVNNGKHVEY